MRTGNRLPVQQEQLRRAPGLYVKVSLAEPIKISQLRQGDIVEGDLARDVYSADPSCFRQGAAYE